MKTINLLCLCLFVGFFASCNQDDDRSSETAKFAVPVIKSLETLRNSISVTSAQETNSDGKIYIAENLLFYIAQESGIHIFDNSNPANPQNRAFINLEGVHDIAIKDNYLYADNFIDLVVFDISDINNIEVVRVAENVISFYPTYPSDAEFYA